MTQSSISEKTPEGDLRRTLHHITELLYPFAAAWIEDEPHHPIIHYSPEQRILFPYPAKESFLRGHLTEAEVAERMDKLIGPLKMKQHEVLALELLNPGGAELSIRYIPVIGDRSQSALVHTFQNFNMRDIFASRNHTPQQNNHPWDRSYSQILIRRDDRGHNHVIEPGIAPFVRLIEAVGGRSTYSCEGHPTGSYLATRLLPELHPPIQAAAKSFQADVNFGRPGINGDLTKQMVIRIPHLPPTLDYKVESMEVRNHMLRMAYDELYEALKPYFIKNPESKFSPSA